jgi:hypothetical protein
MLAGLEIIVLWLMIYEPTFTLLKLIKWLFIFTLFIWVSFAAVLNGSIWWLNKCLQLVLVFSLFWLEEENYFFKADFLNSVFLQEIH